MDRHMNKSFFYQREEGVSLYLTLMIMAIMLAIGLGLTTIFVSRTAMLREIGDSVVAFYAAYTGVENILYEDWKCRQQECNEEHCISGCEEGLSEFSTSIDLENGSRYEARFDIEDRDKIIESIGNYQATRRGIRAVK